MSKLMLVEDDNNLREIYEARLQAEGYDIVAAKDGEEALVIAKAERPDLIISDVMMPKISGFEMLDILRNTDELKNVKIIMLTALGQSDDQQRADRLGADRYLVKSQVTLEDIVKVAHELLQDEIAEPPQEAPPAVPEPAVVAAAAVPAPQPPAAAPVPVPAPLAVEPAIAPTVEPPAPAAVVADPIVTSAPEPAPSPTAAAPAAAAPAEASSPATGSVAQSTADEEAGIEAKIEDFVAGASSEPTQPPADADGAADAASSAADSEADDILMAGAVQSLVDSTTPSPVEATPVAAPEVAAAAMPPAIIPDSAPAALPPAAEPVTPTPAVQNEPASVSGGSVHIANKKVIKPIDETPQKDIKTLLAIEEIAEKAAQGPPPPVAIIATDEAGSQAVPLPETPKISLATSGTQQAVNPETEADPEDPNSIAL